MPKLKTNRSAAKRFRVTGSGRVKYKKRGLRHGLENHSKDTKRKLRQNGILHSRDEDNVLVMIPYK